MNSEKRHAGFVLGSVPKHGSEVWTVRVKDPESEHNGKKLSVISVHKDVQLAVGLNVTFLVGSVDGPNGEKILKAVDVRLA